MAYKMLGNVNAAIYNYKSSIEIRSKKYTINDNQPEQAIEIINQILQLKPNYNIALLNKALFLCKLNRQTEANKIYDFLIKHYPGDYLPYYRKAEILYLETQKIT